MKDDFGQPRASITVRELIIAVSFVAVTAVGVWAVLLPALDHDDVTQQPPREADADDAAGTQSTP